MPSCSFSRLHTQLRRGANPFRTYSTSSLNVHSQPNLSQAMRELMVHNAQSVSIVTTLMEEEAHEHGGSTPPHYHGATISSFASVAMHPYPTIAFSLLLPSRLAHSLRTSMNRHSAPPSPHMVINFLSSSQADLAVRFSRPDRYPTPFKGLDLRITQEGQPAIEGCVGAISCTVLRSFRLDFNEPLADERGVSELFIARVMRIEENDVLKNPRRPLVYLSRNFGTVDVFEKTPSTR